MNPTSPIHSFQENSKYTWTKRGVTAAVIVAAAKTADPLAIIGSVAFGVLNIVNIVTRWADKQTLMGHNIVKLAATATLATISAVALLSIAEIPLTALLVSKLALAIASPSLLELLVENAIAYFRASQKADSQKPAPIPTPTPVSKPEDKPTPSTERSTASDLANTAVRAVRKKKARERTAHLATLARTIRTSTFKAGDVTSTMYPEDAREVEVSKEEFPRGATLQRKQSYAKAVARLATFSLEQREIARQELEKLVEEGFETALVLLLDQFDIELSEERVSQFRYFEVLDALDEFNNSNIEEGLKKLNALHCEGVKGAGRLLAAYTLRYGDGVDAEIAFGQLVTMADNLKCVFASELLGQYYASGLTNGKDSHTRDHAIHYLEQAALNGGILSAAEALVQVCEEGGPKSKEKLAFWKARVLTATEEPNEAHRAAVALLNSEKDEDRQEAIEILQLLVRNENYELDYQALIRHCQNGELRQELNQLIALGKEHNVPFCVAMFHYEACTESLENFSEAEKVLLKLKEEGATFVDLLLGFIYVEIEEKRAEGFKILESLANAKDADAANFLAKIYADEDNAYDVEVTPELRRKGRLYVNIGAEGGLASSRQLKKEMRENLTAARAHLAVPAPPSPPLPPSGTPVPALDLSPLLERAASTESVASVDPKYVPFPVKSPEDTRYTLAVQSLQKEGEREDAFNEFLALAELGYLRAFREVVQCYEHGIGVEVDLDACNEWIAKGKEQGCNFCKAMDIVDQFRDGLKFRAALGLIKKLKKVDENMGNLALGLVQLERRKEKEAQKLLMPLAEAGDFKAAAALVSRADKDPPAEIARVAASRGHDSSLDLLSRLQEESGGGK